MKAAVNDVKKLAGPEKAAIVLLALGEEHTAIWEALDDEEIKEVSQAMAGLGTVSASVVEELLVEFVSGMSSTGAIMGSYEQTQRLLSAFMPPEKVDQLMEEIRGPAGRTMWDKLGNVNEAVLANYLKNEYPQTVAVVLSKVKSDHAARVLASLPEDFALECVTRMLRMEPVQREILDKIEQTLRTEFMSNLARTSKRDSHEMMA
ncbi:MAG: flagellar motor switch protein FliG, partial [Caulobacter sp.]|nr:flagellar motor switch protein FliG [Caulobacter sp.]